MSSCIRAIYRIDAAADGPAMARAILDRELSGVVPRTTLEELELMVSELVTNGFKFGVKDKNDSITLDLRVEGEVRCSVTDPGPGFNGEDPRGAVGWGLKVVERLADRWGVTRGREGTRVWFEAGLG